MVHLLPKPLALRSHLAHNGTDLSEDVSPRETGGEDDPMLLGLGFGVGGVGFRVGGIRRV